MATTDGLRKEEKVSACFLLIYGIPGSGKSLLIDHLLASPQSDQSPWNMLPVHFDDLMPADQRTQVSEEKAMAEEAGQHFLLKDARQKVSKCIKHLAWLNNFGSGEGSQDGDSSPVPPPQWEQFLRSINNSSCRDTPVLNASGKITLRRPTVILLDDNMPLRSMRYEYYQLARNYEMGFAGLCIECPASLALQRNSQRLIPIPYSTIKTMEQRLELPDPAQYHWEARNLVLRNDREKEPFLRLAWKEAFSLMEDALANPVPLPLKENTAIKLLSELAMDVVLVFFYFRKSFLEDHPTALASNIAVGCCVKDSTFPIRRWQAHLHNITDSCRVANLDSYIHQADNTLRKCVSNAVRKGSGHESHQKKSLFTVEGLAKQANSVRKQVLEEVRTGRLGGEPLSSGISPTGAEFKAAIEAAFLLRLNTNPEDQC